MEAAALIKSFAALLFVIALIGGVSILARKYGPGKFLSAGIIRNPKARRLKVVETLPLDARRRLVLIKRDDAEHLLLLGEKDILIEPGIKEAKAEL